MLSMTFDEQACGHQRCAEPHLARLRALADGEARSPFPRQVTAEVRKATSAVIAEVVAACRAALAATVGSRGPEAEACLWAALARLASAAHAAVSAARDADAHGLRHHLDHFDTLATATWAAQHSVVHPSPELGRRPRLRLVADGEQGEPHEHHLPGDGR